MMIFRGDHIVPSFEEIWPSRGPTKRVKRGIEYYLDVRGDNDDDVDDDEYDFSSAYFHLINALSINESTQ